MLALAVTGVNEAQATVAHDTASESHTGTAGSANQASFTWTHTPAGTPRGVLVFVFTASATQTVTSVTYGGVAMTQVAGGAAVDNFGEPGRTDTFFLGTGIPTGARPVVVNRTNNAVVMYATAITVTAATDTAVTGIVLLQNNGTLAEQSVNDGTTGVDSVRYAGVYSGLDAPPAAGANSTSLHNINFATTTYSAATVRETTAGQGSRPVGFSSAVNDDRAAVHLAVVEFATTIATGSDPGATTVAPGTPTADVNRFTLQTNAGTETVTSVTVDLSTNSGIGRLAITDASDVELGFTTSPVTGSNTISVAGMSAVSGSATTFKVRVTPLSHAAMFAPPGGAYDITAPVTSWAGNYPNHAGSDTNPNALTIDNLSPGDVTGASGTAGDSQVVLNWFNPTTPPETVAYSIVVLRSTAAVADTPVEGATYAVGNTIGASTVRCVVTGLPPATTCTDSGAGGPANDTTYYYKIFTRDSNGNYSTPGVPLGPFTPAATRYAVATGNWDAPTTWSAGGCSGAAGASVPTALNNVVICATRTVTLNVVNGACNNLTFDATGAGSTLQHNAGMALSVGGNVTINGSSDTNGTKLWSIGAGSATVGGGVTLNGGNSNARIAQINTTTGTLTVSGGLTYNASGIGGAVRAVINMSGGAGTLNLAGALTINTLGTLTPGTTSTFNYNGTAAQTVRIGVSSIVYNNLYVNNTSAGGATLDAAISATNVTGDVRVQNGILNNGGFAIVGNATKTFEVVDGARFNLTGTSAMASGFGTRTFGAASTVNFNGGNQTVASGLTYGHLILDGGSTKTMAAGTTTIAGDFTLGTGTTRASTNNPTVNLAGNFSNSGTFNAGTGVFTFDGNVSKTITGATTFGNLTIAKTGGATVTANSDLAITRNFVNTAGFNAGSTTTTFNGTIDQTITGATTFYNLTLNNTNGSNTELTLNNDVTVNDTFTFTLGNVVTGANALVIGNTTACGVTGAGTGVGYVVGNLRKNFTASLLSCAFEIGDSALYTPVSALTFASVTTPGTVTASVSALDCADLVNSGINSASNVQRCWTLTAGGSLAFTTAGATFEYDAGDVDAGAVPDDFIIRRKDGGTWFAVPVHPTIVPTTTTTRTSDTGITAFGDFAIGNPGFTYTRESEFIYTRELYY